LKVADLSLPFHSHPVRKWVASLQLSRNDGFLGGVNHLFLQRHAGLKGKPEWNHSRTHANEVVREPVFHSDLPLLQFL
jgi:hypothetical protein